MPVQIQDILPPKHAYERHLPVAIIVDRSGSMNQDDAIGELNKALKFFGDAMSKDSMAQGRVDVTVISFANDVTVDMGFRSAEEYEAPSYTAYGGTSFNEAILVALDALEARKAEYRQMGINYYRPMLFGLTDGFPTDGPKEPEAKARLREYNERKKVSFIPVAMGDANIKHLQSYYPENAEARPVLRVKNPEDLKDVFRWLSDSLGITSKSDPKQGTVQSAPIPSTITLGL